MHPAALANNGSFAHVAPNATHVCTARSKFGVKLVMTFRGRDERGLDAAAQAEDFRRQHEHYGHTVSVEVLP